MDRPGQRRQRSGPRRNRVPPSQQHFTLYDYVNALEGAQRRIKERTRALQSADADSNPCTAVLWFTDGKLDIEDRTSGSRIKRGADESGESRFKDYAAGDRSHRRGRRRSRQGTGHRRAVPPRRDRRSAPGIGDDAPGRCAHDRARPGRRGPAPEDRSRHTGRMRPDGRTEQRRLAASRRRPLRIDRLLRLGRPDDLQSRRRGQASTRASVRVDQTACPEGTRTFDVDASLQRFHVLAQFGTPDIAVRITAPGADPLDVPRTGSGPLEAGETPLNFVNLSAGALTIDAESAPSGGNWAGTWSVTFIDTTGQNPRATNRATVYLFGDVVPSLSEATFRVGEESPLSVALTREWDSDSARGFHRRCEGVRQRHRPILRRVPGSRAARSRHRRNLDRHLPGA